jgi:acetolactate synthase-1/3 small subunit
VATDPRDARTMRHIISILLQNEAGALTRVASLFSTRGFNIESLSVAPTEDPLFSRLTLVTIGSDQVIDQINKQLLKLVDVVNMADMTRGDHIERELLLMKISVPDDAWDRINDLVRREGARVLDDNRATFTLELTSTCGRIDDFVEKAGNLASILTVVRSGPMAIGRGAQQLATPVAN